jgi:hypothetical protein
MKLTQRDMEIMWFINEFGFCEITQIEKMFELKKPRSYQIMQRLVNEKLVIHKKIFHGRNGIYYLSKQGATHTDLPAITNIPVAVYDHQLAIIELFFKLRQEYPETEWISERKMKHDKFSKSIGKIGHIADGMLLFHDNNIQIAIEVELTMKGKSRLERIFKAYVGQFDIKEVWYFCSQEVLPRMQKIAKEKSYIKIYSLDQIPDNLSKHTQHT